MAEEVGPEPTHGDVKDRDSEIAHRQHFERGQAVVDQHLVDDDLEEKRRDERQDLDEERGDQHVAQQVAIFDQRWDEPAHVERARGARHTLARGHQDEFACIVFGKYIESHGLRPIAGGMKQQGLVGRNLQDQEETAGFVLGDGWQRLTIKTRNRRFDFTRTDIQLFCQRRMSSLSSGAPPLPAGVTQLFGIGGLCKKPNIKMSAPSALSAFARSANALKGATSPRPWSPVPPQSRSGSLKKLLTHEVSNTTRAFDATLYKSHNPANSIGRRVSVRYKAATHFLDRCDLSHNVTRGAIMSLCPIEVPSGVAAHLFSAVMHQRANICDRHAVILGPSLTGLGKRPLFTPAHQVDLLHRNGPVRGQNELRRT